MRILWVKPGGLWPLTSGGRLRSFHMVSELARHHRVTILTTHDPTEDPQALAARLPHCEAVVSFPHRVPKQGSRGFLLALLGSWLSPLPVDLWRWRVSALRRHLDGLAGSADLCVADFLAAMPSVSTGRSLPILLFEHNVEYLIWRRLHQVEPSRARRLLLALEWRKMQRYEARACRRAAATVAVSETDRAVLAELAPAARIWSVPTGVDTTYFAPNGTREVPGRLVFTGSMDWFPNEDSILYFAEAILPEIRRHRPDVSLEVVGRNPTARLRALAEARGILVTGTVDDVRPHIERAQVYVVPLRVGGGTRLKIFEALAMEKAVVSSSIGAEGLPLVPGAHFVRVDDPVEFARAVVALLADPERRRTLAAAGRGLVEARYSWPQVAREFVSRCEEVAAHHAR